MRGNDVFSDAWGLWRGEVDGPRCWGTAAWHGADPKTLGAVFGNVGGKGGPVPCGGIRMTPSPQVEPVFPGGWERAPEITSGGCCAHSACLCSVEPNHTYCCRACARAGEESDACQCGHFGCTARA